MKKVLLVLCTTFLFIAAIPIQENESQSVNSSQWIIKEWLTDPILGSDSDGWIVVGDFNLTIQTFGSVTTVYRVATPGFVYNYTLPAGIVGSTLHGGGGAYVRILDGGNATVTIGMTTISIPLADDDEYDFN